jgi:ATP-binding cassette subfamily F protein 3
MIQLSCLTKSFGDRTLFDRVTWQISDRECVGLCGPNGAGKTTLLKIMAGLEEPDAGGVLKPSGLTIGYLPQDGLAHSGRTVYDEVATAFQRLLDVRTEMHALETRLGDESVPEGEHEAMLVRYAELTEEFRHRDGYAIDLKIATVLRGLGFSQADAERPAETFSGGWQMRIALAKLLLQQPGLLLLDEPTNHLDLDARNWLEGYLSEYPHAVILVSHDRFFLDAVVTRIADLSLRTITDYPGNYSHYVTERDARLEQLRQAKKDQDEEVARIKMFVDRFRYQATKAAQVQSRIKLLDKVVPIEVPPERKRIHFTFPACARSGRMVMELKHVRKAYGDLVVFHDLSLHIERGDRIALVGPNGAGKSTLMRMLSGVEAPDRGTRQEGHQVVKEYFAQDEATRLSPVLTVHDTLQDGSPVHMVPMIRNILGGFLFTGDDVYKRAGVLSGGERTRLAVARMLLRPSNTLLLDEPTNHLDLDSKDVLLDALADYGGTLIFVSHDRYFVERLATKIVEVGGGQAILFPGTYPEFLWRKEHPEALGARTAERPQPRANAAKPAAPAAAAPNTRPAASSRPHAPGPPHAPQPARAANPAAEHEARKRERAEQTRRDRELQARRSRLADLETRIADRERAIGELEAAMAKPGFYEQRDAAQPVIDRHQALMWEVGELMHQWETLSELLESPQVGS